MNRIMVLLGLGFCFSVLCPCLGCADMPVSVQDAFPNVASAPLAWHTNLQSGWRESKRLGVPMVIFITTDNCVYCDAMKQNTWCDRSIQRRMAGKFIAIRLNPVRNAKTLSRIKVDTFPTTLLGTPNGKVVGHRIGYQPPAALQSFLAEASSDLMVVASDVRTVH